MSVRSDDPGVAGRHVAIVGGGVSGLVAAYRLRRLLGPRLRITVIEQDRRLGGKLRTVYLAGQRFDVGAEAFLARRPEVLDLITELGLAHEVVHATGARSALRAGGRNVLVPTRTLMGVPASADDVRDVLSPEGLAAVAAEPDLPPLRLDETGAGADGADGADVAVGALLRRRLGDEVVDRLVDPLLGGVYAGRADNLGLRATMPGLAAALDAGAGSVLAAVGSMLPPTPPPGTPRTPVFGSLRGGLATLVDRLVVASSARVRLGLPVRALRRTGHGWRLEIGAAPHPDVLDVDAVVLAVPAPAARRLLADVSPRAAEAYRCIDVASMAVVALAFPVDTQLPDTSGVLIAEGERHADGTPFTAKAFTFSSRKWGHLAGRYVMVRGSVGRYGETGTLQRDDVDLVAAVRSDLAELTGITAEPVESAVIRWGGGLPQYGVGHLAAVRRIEAAVTELPGLAVAGAALHGVGVPACVATAEAAAGRVAAHLLSLPRSESATMEAWPV